MPATGSYPATGATVPWGGHWCTLGRAYSEIKALRAKIRRWFCLPYTLVDLPSAPPSPHIVEWQAPVVSQSHLHLKDGTAYRPIRPDSEVWRKAGEPGCLASLSSQF